MGSDLPLGSVFFGSCAIQAYVDTMVRQGVRMRLGEPRHIDWSEEAGWAETLQVATSDMNQVPMTSLEVKRAPGNCGMGLFATAPMTKASYLFPYNGALLKHDRTFTSEETTYAISVCNAWGDPFLVDASDPTSGLGCYMNHDGTEPNCQCVRSAFTRSSDRPGAPPPVLHVFTKRAIEVGEELRWNYGEKYWDREDRVAE